MAKITQDQVQAFANENGISYMEAKRILFAELKPAKEAKKEKTEE